jgi:serine/threonine protein kinase
MKGEKRVENYTFNLKDVLGTGSFGEVYKGKDIKTNKIFAIKMINKKIIDSDEYLRQSLMNEIKVMKKLKSKYIVELVDILETTNNYYLIQEFCDSGDLAG